MLKSTGRGGKREGSGRKKLYDEETETICFKVPSSKVEIIKKIVTDKLKQFKKAAVKTVKALLTFSLIILMGCKSKNSFTVSKGLQPDSLLYGIDSVTLNPNDSTLFIYRTVAPNLSYDTITFEGVSNDPPYKGKAKFTYSGYDTVYKINDSTLVFRRKINYSK